MAPSGDGLRLAAEGQQDLAVISAALQDATFLVGDLKFNRRRRQLILEVNRFRWERAGRHGPFSRVRCAVVIEGVSTVKTRRLRQDTPDAVAAVLSLQFTPDAEPPGGVFSFILAGDGVVAVSVEAVDLLLVDLGEPWPTPNRPDHDRPHPSRRGEKDV